MHKLFPTKEHHYKIALASWMELSALFLDQGNTKEWFTTGISVCIVLKFQSVVVPNGLIAHLYGPVGESLLTVPN